MATTPENPDLLDETLAIFDRNFWSALPTGTPEGLEVPLGIGFLQLLKEDPEGTPHWHARRGIEAVERCRSAIAENDTRAAAAEAMQVVHHAFGLGVEHGLSLAELAEKGGAALSALKKGPSAAGKKTGGSSKLESEKLKRSLLEYWRGKSDTYKGWGWKLRLAKDFKRDTKTPAELSTLQHKLAGLETLDDAERWLDAHPHPKNAER